MSQFCVDGGLMIMFKTILGHFDVSFKKNVVIIVVYYGCRLYFLLQQQFMGNQRLCLAPRSIPSMS